MLYNNYLNHPPKPYQAEGIKFAMEHHYSILADDMGLGKTMQAISVSLIGMHRTLIVCPAYLKLNWEDEINFFSKKPVKVFVCRTSKDLTLLDPEGYDFIVCNYEQLSNNNMVNIFKWADMICCDEAHALKNVKAKRTKAFHQYLYDHRPERLMLLSGTPITNNVGDWYSLIMLTSYNPKNTSGMGLDGVSYWDFCSKFCLQRQQSIGGGRTAKIFYGLRNVEGLKKLLRGKYIRRLAKDVLDLKEVTEKTVVVDVESDPSLEDAWQEYKETEKLSVNATIKKASAVMVAPFTAELAVGMLNGGSGPLVIFSDHVDPVRIITEGIMRKRSGTVVREIVGGISINERKQITDAYKRGAVDVIVATIPAASTGLTLVAGNRIIFNDPSYNPAQNAQAFKRVHRIGQTKPVFAYYVAPKGIYSKIISKLREKMTVLRSAM